MSVPTLWLGFIDGADGGPAPRLRADPDPGSPALPLSDRARWVLAAISLPRELTPETASDELARARLGPRLWSSGEITALIPYQHRSTIRHALSDLRALLGEGGLVLEDYLVIDTARGRYGVRADRVTVDLVELHACRHDPDAVDRCLDGTVADRRHAHLAPVCGHLLADAPHDELQRAIAASAARALAAGPAPGGTRGPDPGGGQDTAPAPGEPSGRPPGPAASPARRRLRLLLPALAAVVAAAVVAGVLLTGGDRRAGATIHADGPPRTEVAGGVAHTWSDPVTAGGHMGREIFGGERVSIACRAPGFVVPDGNRWWYLIQSKPWSRHYFVTADAFYNNGRTSGSLRGSAFVDPKVARCSPLPRSWR